MGKKVNLNYNYAIVLAAPLEKNYVNRSPFAEVQMATMKGYSDTSAVAAQVSLYIKNLGHEACTDDFLEYHSPMVPLALAAGIGQLGRSNLVVNPVYGNRMKMGAVLTNIPLIADEPLDFGLTEFCKLCGKCARNCPAKAISQAEPLVSGDMEYWPHNEAGCMKMWMKVETDCGICMSSCPFSQGVDQELVQSMKWNTEIMELILKEDYEKYGKRNFIKTPLSVTENLS